MFNVDGFGVNSKLVVTPDSVYGTTQTPVQLNQVLDVA